MLKKKNWKNGACCLAFFILLSACGGGGSGTGTLLGTISTASHILFVSNLQTVDPTKYQLYGVAASGADDPILISDTTSAGDGASFGAWSYNNAWVAYGADEDTDGLVELYIINPSSGESRTKISGTMASGAAGLKPILEGSFPANPNSIRWSSVANKIAYVADQETAGVYELYIVDVSSGTPSTPVKVNDTLVSGGDIRKFGWSPDGTMIAYLADQESDEVYELYLVDVAGSSPGDPVKLNSDLMSPMLVLDFGFSPDSQNIAYTANQDDADDIELYNVDLSSADPADPDKVNTTLVSGGDVGGAVPPNLSGDPLFFAWSPDSSILAYYADLATNGVGELWFADATSFPSAKRVNSLGSADEEVALSTSAGPSFKFSPSGAYIVYQWNDSSSADDVVELYVATVTSASVTGTPTKAHESFAPGAGEERAVIYFGWSPDSTMIAYIADKDTDGLYDLFSVNINNLGTSTQITSSLTGVTVVSGFNWSPDSDSIIFEARVGSSPLSDLYVLEESSSTAVNLSDNTNTVGLIHGAETLNNVNYPWAY